MKKVLTSRWMLPVGGLALGLAAIALLLFWLRPHTFAGTVMQSPQPAYDFVLQGVDGRDVRLSDFRGQAVLLFFGYTYCPDVCPGTLGVMRQVLYEMGERAEKVRVVFISVDPPRDTPERLKLYLERIDERMVGLSGAPDTLLDVATRYGIFYQRREGKDPEHYLIDHTATVLLIDPDGFLRVVYPFGTNSGGIISDLNYIFDH